MSEIQIKRMRAENERLRAALKPFTFPAYPDKFQSEDGGCTEVLIPDEHVQEARRLLGTAWRA
jgi:hypothetical protein